MYPVNIGNYLTPFGGGLERNVTVWCKSDSPANILRAEMNLFIACSGK